MALRNAAPALEGHRLEVEVQMSVAESSPTEPHAAKPCRRAAFYDVDGTLVRTNVVHAFAYYTLSHPSWQRKVFGMARLLANIPVYLALDKFGRKAFNEYFYSGYKGFSEDRLVVVGEEVFDKVMKPAIFPGVFDLVSRSKDQGVEQVIVTGALDYVAAPLARHLGIEKWLANRLEIVDDMATGRLIPPLLAGPNKSLVIREYGRAHDIDLDSSFAYADSFSDFPMLAMVGHPVAVNPDTKLRRIAEDYSWPVISVQS